MLYLFYTMQFNNGCDISCDTCDGSTGQVVHPKWTWTGKPGAENYPA